jgi:ClpP class serine protease
MMHIDQSKLLEKNGETVTLIQYGENKVDGNPYAPLSDSAREHLMHLVSTAGRMFEQGVADNLGIDVARVHDTFGQGRVFSAQESLKRGMVHRVASFDDVMNLAAAAAATKRKTNASASSVRNSGGMSASRARLELNRSSVRQA